jgi:hypothetical protein
VKYILDENGNPKREDNTEVWGRWFENAAGRIVKQDTVLDDRVSTVFLGLDHNYYREGPPILWETMVFGGPHDGYQMRYSSKEEALLGHDLAVAMVRGEVKSE